MLSSGSFLFICNSGEGEREREMEEERDRWKDLLAGGNGFLSCKEDLDADLYIKGRGLLRTRHVFVWRGHLSCDGQPSVLEGVGLAS